MNTKNILTLTIIVFIIAFVVGGIYWWQQKNELRKQIYSLQTQLDQTTADRNALQQQIEDFTKIEEPIGESERYIKIISPNGGETLCLDDYFLIGWESKDVDLITLRVVMLEAGSTGYYMIDTVPADYLTEEKKSGKGYFLWKAGNTKGGVRLEGYNYKIQAKSVDDTPISDTSDSVFQIILCKG